MSDQEDEGAVQGAVVGIIVPPPDKRVICDKTAEFVARNGPSFMKKIRATDPTGRKFSFLNGDDIYNAYFLKKVKDFQAAHAAKAEAQETQKQAEADAGVGAQQPAAPAAGAGGGEAPAGEQAASGAADGEAVPEGEKKEAIGAVQKDAVITVVAAAAKNIPDGPPPPELFSLMHPSAQESAMQIDIIKHTAQYTAVSGSDFLKGLAGREHRNPQFDFLKHTHAYFGYFTALVESYSKILTKNPVVFARLKADALSTDHILRRCVHRMTFQRKEEERRKAEQEEGDEDRMAFQQIDWHDFVVVETIDFGEDEELPAPGAAPGVVQDEDVGDEDMDMDMDMSESEEETAPTVSVPADSGIKIRSDYVPQVGVEKKQKVTHFIDPKTGKQVPIEDASDHMRIELMDPKYMEQQARRREKQRETAYVQDETISANLARLAKRRTDIFGGDKQAEEEQVAPAVIWDGVTADPEVKQKLTMQAARAQLAREKKARENAVPKPAIGPTVPGSQPPPPPAPTASGVPAPAAPAAGSGPPGGLGPGSLGMRALMGGGMAGMGMGMPPPPPMPPASAAPPPPSVPGLAPPGVPGVPGLGPRPPTRPRPEEDPVPQPPAKRSRVTDSGLQAEDAWAAQHPGKHTFAVAVPSDSSNGDWNLNGQTLTSELPMTARVSELKAQLQTHLGDMPTNKMLLKSSERGFLKDTFTLAHYNLAPGETLTMQVKTRGRRR